MTRSALLRAATDRLSAAGVADAARDARLIMRWAAGLGAASLAAVLDDQPDADEAARYEAALLQRLARRPLSHITGQRAFWRHSFFVTPAVLDPRPETETLVAWALEGPAPARILDLGTGSGCILLSLLDVWQQATGLGVDCSAAALDVATRNAASLGLSGRSTFRRGNWLDDIAGPFDMVVSNPPYLATHELDELSPEVTAEPVAALDGGPDGLGAYRAIAAALAEVLTPHGVAYLEIGPTQADAVSATFAAAGFGAALRHDLDGRARVLRFCRV